MSEQWNPSRQLTSLAIKSLPSSTIQNQPGQHRPRQQKLIQSASVHGHKLPLTFTGRQSWPTSLTAHDMMTGFAMMTKLKETSASTADNFAAAFPAHRFVSSTFYDNLAVWDGASTELKQQAMNEEGMSWPEFRKAVCAEQKKLQKSV